MFLALFFHVFFNTKKYLIRKSFNQLDNKILPENILWRTKEAFSDGVLFMGSKGNAVIPAGKEVGGIFAGLIVDEVPSITPVLAVNPVGENISLSVPTDKLFVITSGTPVWNTSVSPSSWDFTVDRKTMPLGVGSPAILPAQASIISGIGETYKILYH